MSLADNFLGVNYGQKGGGGKHVKNCQFAKSFPNLDPPPLAPWIWGTATIEFRLWTNSLQDYGECRGNDHKEQV